MIEHVLSEPGFFLSKKVPLSTPANIVTRNGRTV